MLKWRRERINGGYDLHATGAAGDEYRIARTQAWVIGTKIVYFTLYVNGSRASKGGADRQFECKAQAEQFEQIATEEK